MLRISFEVLKLLVLTGPLRITHSAAVLEFQVLRIRANIQNIPARGIGTTRARLIRTCDRLQVRQRRIQLGVGIQR
jgi:hypothetical protein